MKSSASVYHGSCFSQSNSRFVPKATYDDNDTTVMCDHGYLPKHEDMNR